MTNAKILQLIEQLVDAKQKDFRTTGEYLAWRCGYLTSILAAVASRDSLVLQAIIDQLKRHKK